MKLAVAVSVVAVAVAACGVSPPNSFTGSAGDQSLVIAQSIWAVQTVVPIGYTGQAVVVMMSTGADLCARVASNTVLPDEQRVALEMTDVAGTSMSVPGGPGDYVIPIESTLSPKTAWLGTDSFDARCVHTGGLDGRLGTVTVGSIDGDVLTGSFDTFSDFDGTGHATGTFAPQYCPALEQDQSLPPSCL